MVNVKLECYKIEILSNIKVIFSGRAYSFFSNWARKPKEYLNVD